MIGLSSPRLVFDEFPDGELGVPPVDGGWSGGEVGLDIADDGGMGHGA